MADNKLQDAAILLMSMGKQAAAEVLKMLKPKQVEKLVEEIRALESVSEKEMVKTLNTFLQKSSGETGLIMNSDDFIRDALIDAVGTEKAGSILDKSTVDDKGKILQSLNWQPAKIIADIIQHEHKQVITIIFTYLDNEKAAQVLSLLPKEHCSDIVKRLSHVGPISPVALEELAAMLDEQIIDGGYFKELPLGGIDAAANIVNFLDSELENEIIDNITKFDQALSEKIKERMFPFERLADIDDRSLQMLLRDVSNDILVIALKGTDESVRSVFLKNMSGRAAAMLKDDLEAMGPISLSKVEAAQKEIVTTAQRLSKEGKVILDTNSGDMVM